MTGREGQDVVGVTNALFVAATAAAAVFIGMVVFSPEEHGKNEPPMSQAADFTELNEDDVTPSPGPDGDEVQEERRPSRRSLTRSEKMQRIWTNR